MAMTIRFDDDETEQLRRQAALEGVPMAEVVRRAVRERIDRLRVRDRLLEAWGPIPQEEMDRAAASLERDRSRSVS
jgi:Ribbon-helix-helix protein, copG family.